MTVGVSQPNVAGYSPNRTQARSRREIAGTEDQTLVAQSTHPQSTQSIQPQEIQEFQEQREIGNGIDLVSVRLGVSDEDLDKMLKGAGTFTDMYYLMNPGVSRETSLYDYSGSTGGQDDATMGSMFHAQLVSIKENLRSRKSGHQHNTMPLRANDGPYKHRVYITTTDKQRISLGQFAGLYGDKGSAARRTFMSPPSNGSLKKLQYNNYVISQSGKALTPGQLEGLAAQAAQKYGLPKNLLIAQAYKESSGNPDAVSVIRGKPGAMGLMQIMPQTGKELGLVNPFDPAESMDKGAKYMRELLDQYNGDIELALAAYNWGPGNVNKHLKKAPPGSYDRMYARVGNMETPNYVSTILANFELLERGVINVHSIRNKYDV